MPAMPRNQILDRENTGVYHCMARCVRRAFLCGKDKYTGKNYEHRRQWIEDRVRLLAGLFAVDVVFFCAMANHLHLVLRNLPHLAASWSDREVIRRACKIFPFKFQKLGVQNGEPTPLQLKALASDGKLVAQMRQRLSDISWFMRQLSQYIARRSNDEDGCRGHFWQERYRCLKITDPAGVLICGVYVDLNQIHAGEAKTPETSQHTSAYHRIKGRQARRRDSRQAVTWDGFLSPINTRGDDQGGYPPAGRFGGQRASDCGLLDMSLEDYLNLLDWAGRELRSDKRGRIPADLPAILDRLDLTAKSFLSYVEQFDSLFRVAVGLPKTLVQFAARLGRRWLQKAQAVAAIAGAE